MAASPPLVLTATAESSFLSNSLRFPFAPEDSESDVSAGHCRARVEGELPQAVDGEKELVAFVLYQRHADREADWDAR